MTPKEIKRIRTRLGWTQNQTADYLGVAKITVASYERGLRPVPAPISKLMELLATGEIVIRPGRIIQTEDTDDE